MKTRTNLFLLATISAALVFSGCNQNSSGSGVADGVGMSNISEDSNTILKIAVSSKDHTTLVAAVKAAGLVDTLANPGPFTVFAPTDAAFAALPEGTVDTLMKPENKGKLTDILYYHTLTSMYKDFKDGQQITMLSGQPIKITVKDGATYVNDAKILATVQGSNGVVQVIDKVLLPK